MRTILRTSKSLPIYPKLIIGSFNQRTLYISYINPYLSTISATSSFPFDAVIKDAPLLLTLAMIYHPNTDALLGK